MIKLLASVVLVFGMISGLGAEPEIKRVCVDRITPDGKPVIGKDGKPVQDCKEIKVHKKLEGTKVPDKK